MWYFCGIFRTLALGIIFVRNAFEEASPSFRVRFISIRLRSGRARIACMCREDTRVSLAFGFGFGFGVLHREANDVPGIGWLVA